jgi:hypothetical protein
LPFTGERENDEAAEFAGEGGKWSGVPRLGGRRSIKEDDGGKVCLKRALSIWTWICGVVVVVMVFGVLGEEWSDREVNMLV